MPGKLSRAFFGGKKVVGSLCRAFPERKKCPAASAERILGVKKCPAASAEHFLGEKSVRQTLPSVSTTAKSNENLKKNKEQDNETEI